MKKLVITALISASLFGLGTSTSAQGAVHTVKSGDTLFKISQAYGVSLPSIISLNQNLNPNWIYPGQKIQLPSTLTTEEINLMAKLVHAEAKGEPYAGKVAVATVVLNRVDHKDFPNTVKGVIYEKSNGYYAFSPVANGQINQAADAESYRAVREAIAFRGQGKGSVFFYNPAKITNKWILSRQTTITIGNHVFAK
ncbi:hypothetical protein GCM10008967_13910 [Bacillus carboniphilus]|uniref:LysM domain-containing protein n=1 Tax=Bacillus carboniphilus TaxID=86663 RepID=A0ABN0W432_9BACI